MARKLDIRQVDAVAKEFGMSPLQRHLFGEYIEECKRAGEIGSASRGDYTYAELRLKAAQFLGES